MRTMLEESINVLGELSGNREDGYAGALVSGDLAVRRAKGRLGLPDGDSGHAEGAGNPGGPRPVVQLLRGLPPEIGVRGHSRSQDTKCFSVGNAFMSVPTSVKTT